MSYTFNGTAIYIYGSKRENHGAYSGKSHPYVSLWDIEAKGTVSIDGAEPIVQLGHASAPGAYQQLLFSAGNLDTGTEHEVRVTNLPSQTPDTSERQ